MGELPAWMSGKGKKRTQNRRSRNHERELAREVGGLQNAASGSRTSRADVRARRELIEHKYTDAKSFTIDIERLWIPLVRKAERAGRDPVLVINFDQHGRRLIVTEG